MKILLISYYFPPYNSIGAVRPGKFGKFLHQQGHEVHVVSGKQPYPEGIDLELPESNVVYPKWRSFLEVLGAISGTGDTAANSGYVSATEKFVLKSWLRKQARTALFWPDGQRGWVTNATQAGRDLMRSKEFDLIYCSTPSFSGLMVAHRLSEEFSTPWIAEFRDLWTDNHYFRSPWIKAKIEAWLERRLLSTSSAIVTVSDPLARKLRKHGKPVWIIKNGYDADEFREAANTRNSLRDHIHIVFTGNVYRENNDIDCFCNGVRMFVENGGLPKLTIVGRNTSPLKQSIKDAGLQKYSQFKDTVSRKEALELQKSADVLLLFLWLGADQGIFGTKLYEYAGSQNPILAIGPKNNDVAQFIERKKIGKVAENKNELSDLLSDWQARKLDDYHIKLKDTPPVDLTREYQFAKLESLLSENVKKWST